MKRKRCSILIISVFLVVLICTMSQTMAISATNHTINLDPGDDYLFVTEKITVSSDELNGSFFVSLWIPSEADDLKMTINNTVLSFSLVEDNVYEANLSSVTNALQSSEPIEISYILAMGSDDFSKMILRDTNELTINYDNKVLLSASAVSEETMVSVVLPVSENQALFNVYTLTLTVLLIILLLVSFVYGIRKKKNGKARVRSFESNELLSTEKSLLMDLLKQIEKMHRSDKMSDDTYHKLKEYYKQQTVEIMSELENLQSKIK